MRKECAWADVAAAAGTPAADTICIEEVYYLFMSYSMEMRPAQYNLNALHLPVFPRHLFNVLLSDDVNVDE